MGIHIREARPKCLSTMAGIRASNGGAAMDLLRNRNERSSSKACLFYATDVDVYFELHPGRLGNA